MWFALARAGEWAGVARQALRQLTPSSLLVLFFFLLFQGCCHSQKANPGPTATATTTAAISMRFNSFAPNCHAGEQRDGIQIGVYTWSSVWYLGTSHSEKLIYENLDEVLVKMKK